MTNISPRGTEDLFGEEIKKFNSIISIAKDKSEVYGYEEVYTPIFEHSEVFEKNLGEESDVVSKEMYKFKDKGDRSITLRPEFTASIARFFSNNSSFKREIPKKFFSYGPLFRYERPQKGRQRQFHQINYELIGDDSYLADIEIIKLGQDILKSCSIGDFSLEINSLGSPNTMFKYKDILIEYLSKYQNELSDDSQIRLQKNPLRILDSKDKTDRDILQDSPIISSVWSKKEEFRFDNILNALTKIGIQYKVNTSIVRGLDYYTSTVFEFVSNNLGAQSTVLAGGRYDNMMKSIGAGDFPAVGFASGIERLMLLCEFDKVTNSTLMILPISENEIEYSFEIANLLREKNIPCDILKTGKFKKRLEKANEKEVQYCIICGEKELEAKDCILKNMISGEEQEININNLYSVIIDLSLKQQLLIKKMS